MRKSRTGEYFKFVEFLSFQPQKFEQTSIPDSLSWRSLIFEFPSQNFSKSLRRIVCSIAESRMKVWFFRTHAVIEKYSIILRIRNKLNASAFRSRTLNENRTVPPPLLPLAAPTLEQSSLTRYSLMPLSFLMTAGSFLWKFIEISNSIAVIKYDHHK